MRILHVLDHSVPVSSGYSFRTLAILQHQRARGWETAQLTSTKHPGATGREEDVEGFRFHRTLPSGGILERLPVVNQLEVIRSLRRRLDQVIRTVAPDILHAHSPALNGAAAVLAARRHALPLVYEMRALWEDGAVSHGTAGEGGLRYRAGRALETWVLRRAAAVTTICEGLKGEIVRRGIPETRVTVVPNAVDPDRFPPSLDRDTALAERLGVGRGPVLGFVGSFYAYEGLEVLLRALPGILARYPAACLVLVGGGPEREGLERLAAGLGLRDRVRFTGWVAHGAVAGHYSVMDVLVYPRLATRLTELVTPLKPLEAMAQGRLVVASDVGGHRELIRDGETGFVFRAGDPEALAKTLCDALGDPGRTTAVRAAGRRFVERERSWAASVARYGPVYRGVTAGADPGSPATDQPDDLVGSAP
ncbi:MAG TPA: TIGR04063 family PEP-CTERM/XrtA system glycosyltransferase [Methylomirabilota bacterium]|nr:TIGR04063 family PEP-CTERM/XrtA system glycosyltransferase [Methylomirabilota bacterium]